MRCCSQTTGDLPPGPFAYRQYSIFLQILHSAALSGHSSIQFIQFSVSGAMPPCYSMLPCPETMCIHMLYPIYCQHAHVKGIRSMYITFTIIIIILYVDVSTHCQYIANTKIRTYVPYTVPYLRTRQYVRTYVPTYIRTCVHAYIHTYMRTYIRT